MFSSDLGGYTVPLPAATDPPFQKVALLLHGDGTNGAQNNTFVDTSTPLGSTELGYAVKFDGSGDYFTVPDSASWDFGTSDFTCECWANFNALTAAGLFGNYDGTTASWYFQRRSDTNRLVFGSGDTQLIYASFTPTVGTWYHFAAARSGTSLKLFINGVTVASITNSTNFTGSTYPLMVGSLTSGLNNFNGYLSNIRVVKGTAVYTSDFTPSNLPLTAISGTQLLTCQSATIVDNSPNSYTVTVNGNTAAVSSKTITRTGNVAQGTFSPFSLAEGQWSNYFDGTGDYLTVPDNTALQFGTGDYTIEAIISLATNNTEKGVIAKWEGGQGWGLVFYSGVSTTRISFYKSAPSLAAVVSDPDSFPLNQFVHVAVTRASGTTRLFVNGALKATNTDTTDYTSTASTAIGQLNTTSWPFNGYISNVRIVKGTAVYTSAFTPPTAALTAISGTSLLTCQSNRFKDNSSNNFTITPTGDTKVTAFSPFTPSTAYSASTNGGSGYFDGSGDYLEAAVSSLTLGTSDFTIEWWQYRSDTTTRNMINIGTTLITSPKNGTNGVQIYKTDNSINVLCSPTLNLYEWNHVAIGRSGGAFSIYINGISQTLTTNVNSGSIATTSTIQVGKADVSSYYSDFLGYASNVRLVTSAIYTANFTPPTAPLTAITNTQLLLNCTNAGIYDNSGKSDIETVGNAQISTSVKKYGTGSMYFDGTGDYLTLQPSIVLNGDFTLECWVYSTGNEADGYSQIFSSTSPNSTQIGYNNSGALIFYAAAWVINQVGTAVTQNSWHHVAFTRSGSTVYGFVDGTQISTGTLASTTAVTITRIGSFISGGYEINGYLDDVRITQGRALYTSNFTPPTQAFPNV